MGSRPKQEPGEQTDFETADARQHVDAVSRVGTVDRQRPLHGPDLVRQTLVDLQKEQVSDHGTVVAKASPEQFDQRRGGIGISMRDVHDRFRGQLVHDGSIHNRPRHDLAGQKRAA